MNVAPTEHQIEEMILALLEKRGEGKTICPSEVARALSDTAWRSLMEEVREVARKLWKRGKVKITQKGKEVNPHEAHGAIRIGRG